MAQNPFGVLQKSLYDWATSITRLQVIWEEQSLARPPKPYVALKLINPGIYVGYDEMRATSNGSTMISGVRELVLSLNVYGVDALDIVGDVQSALWFPSVQEALRSAGLVFVESSEVRNLTTLLETGFESRGQMDIRFRYAKNTVDTATGVIETVDVTGVGDGVLTVETDTETIG